MRKSLLPLVLVILFVFNVRLARSEGLVENYEEVVENVVFEYVFCDLPTFEEGFERDLGVLGDVTGNVYVLSKLTSLVYLLKRCNYFKILCVKVPGFPFKWRIPICWMASCWRCSIHRSEYQGSLSERNPLFHVMQL